MDTQTPQVRRLIRWNRFWLVLVSLYGLSVGYTFLLRRVTHDVFRLHLSWAYSATVKNERSLLFSSAQGGPFVVTHLVKQSVNSNEPAVATLTRPLFVPGVKEQASITTRELNKLVWVETNGKKASAPKPDSPVQALYYVPLNVTTAK